MKIYEHLKNEILEYLYDIPYDILMEDIDQVIEMRTYELYIPRIYSVENIEYNSRKIGSANLTIATTYVAKYLNGIPFVKNLALDYNETQKVVASIWQELLNDLQKDNHIRIVPKIARYEGISLVVDNTKEE